MKVSYGFLTGSEYNIIIILFEFMNMTIYLGLTKTTYILESCEKSKNSSLGLRTYYELTCTIYNQRSEKELDLKFLNFSGGLSASLKPSTDEDNFSLTSFLCQFSFFCTNNNLPKFSLDKRNRSSIL